MRHLNRALHLVFALAALSVPATAFGQTGEKFAKPGTSKSFGGPNDLNIKVHVSKPQDQEADVLFMCVFRQSEFILAIHDFDVGLGGLVSTLRKRGEFSGDELETILISNPPKKSMKAKQLMLIGLGEKDKQTPKLMRRIGTVAMREAVRLGAKRAAFAAALIDQRSPKLKTEDTGYEVIQGAILAFDTEKRLHKEGLAAAPALQEWVYLAGPEFFYHVAPKAEEAVKAAEAAVKARPNEPYVKRK